MDIYQNEGKEKLLKIQEDLFAQAKASEKLINLNEKENQHLMEEFTFRRNKKELVLRNIEALENRIKNLKIDYSGRMFSKEQEIKYLKSALEDNDLRIKEMNQELVDIENKANKIGILSSKYFKQNE